MELFQKLKLSEELMRSLHESGFTSPTEIQEKTIPLVMEGKDVIAQSATGSGKTLSYIIPER